MARKKQCEFFLLRYVPDAVKGEFVNIGVVLVEKGDSPHTFKGLHFTKDWSRVKCLDPLVDVEMLRALKTELHKCPSEVRGSGGAVLQRMKDSFSNALQLSLVKACLTESPQHELGRLAKMYLESRVPFHTSRRASAKKRGKT